MPAAQRRAQIIDAAAELIAERGFWGLTLRDVAYSVNLTEAGLLHHVGNKDRLLIAVLEQRDEIYRDILLEQLGLTTEQLRDADPLPVDLRTVSMALVEYNTAQPEIVRLYSVLEAESLEPAHPAHEFFATRQMLALRLFRRAAAPRPDADRLARQTMAMMDGLQLIWLRDREGVDLVTEWAAAVDALLNAT